MSITKNDLNEALEEQPKIIIKAIDSSVADSEERITKTVLDRIDRLEKFYALDERVKKIEKKLGIELTA